MTCKHLQQLYKLCQDHDLKLGSSDLVRVVCQQCGEKEVCPSTLMDEYDSDDSIDAARAEHNPDDSSGPAS